MEKGDTALPSDYGRLEPVAGARAFVADIADFDMNIQKALEAPRFTKITSKAAMCA